ncbi:MAG: hypothetical protein OEZ39_19020 [Gammaproteobacteria bacterium]|nr:hypothetical protein [Gammaproteobacteria bacterium]MDH5653957.1 hypothetical protein [Gammaproteobacteria bacterium]
MKKYLLIIACLLPVMHSARAEWSGYTALEYRNFFEPAADPRQPDNTGSLILQPEYHYQWDNGRQIFSFIPYYRVDQYDDERSHGDIRELAWVSAAESWELRLGVRKVFWGVTESTHLVDIINQTDLVENPDGEDKLGQPMLNLALIGNYGTLDLFVLPMFRERTFPGVEGRPRLATIVDTRQDALYESDKKDQHVDYAVRWSKSMGILDIGLSHFYGTSRDPEFIFVPGPIPSLLPYYKLIHQTGLDLQVTSEGWLWKLEAVKRSGTNIDYAAATAGLEYTLYGIGGSTTDVGLVVEYMYDDRNKLATTPFNNDLLVGLRFTFNDTQSTDALIGLIYDREYGSTVYSIEAGRRLGDRWKLSVEGRFYRDIDPLDNVLYSLRKEDYLQMELALYF